jgi:hypothetical protein
MKNFFLVLLLFLLSNTAVLRGQQDTLKLALDQVRRVLLTQLQVNGQDAYFLVDTGSGISLIDQQEAERLDFAFHPENGQGKIYGLGGTARFMVTSNIRVSYQGERLRGCRFYTTDLSLLQDFKLPKRYKISGILGADFFHRNQAILDFEQSQILLTRR